MEIVARKIGPHESFPNVGYIEPIFKVEENGQITQLATDELNFKIEAHQYNEIDSYFQKGVLFRIPIRTINDPAGKKFIADSQNAIRLINNVADIIFAELPDRNLKEINLEKKGFPATKIIFLANKDFECYGPFEWEIKDNNNILIKKNTLPLDTFKLPEEFIYKIAFKDLFKFTISNGEKNICLINQLAELGVVFQELNQYFDYSSDQEIINFFTKKLAKRNTPISEITPQHLANSINKHSYSKDIIQQKIELLKEISLEDDKKFDNIYQNLESFFLTGKGKQVVEKYVKKNKDNFESLIHIEKSNEIDEKLKEKEEKLKSINERIEQAREELVFQQSSQVPEISTNFDPRLMEELEELRLKESRYKDLKKMSWEKELLEEQTDKAKKEHYQISNDIKTLMSGARSSALEFKMFWELYSKKEAKEEGLQDLSCPVSTEVSKISENILQAQQICIDLLHHKITKEKNYSLSKLMLANFMLATQQNFITFLAGPPGIGKTSLAKNFCEYQNIKSRLLNVAVAKGWTSQRDLIGFYNPLNESFQASNSGVFNFISSLNQEKIEDNQPTAYILLDEANLSPIEHYWSSFMGQSDYLSKTINLGNKILQIPNNLRFIATINYDETTEKLSPRILNRATIISLDNSISDDISNKIAEGFQDLYPLSYKDAEALFGKVANPSLKPQEDEALKKIIHIFQMKRHDLGRPISVSHRKKAAIEQYCHKGRNLLEIYTDNPLAALDIAITQNLLPLISGYGYGLQKRLNELLDAFDQLNLEHSNSYLRDMLEYGNLEMNSYDFFNI